MTRIPPRPDLAPTDLTRTNLANKDLTNKDLARDLHQEEGRRS